MKKAAGQILDEVIAIAGNLVPKTKHQTFFTEITSKTEEITAAIEDARADGFALGHGEGYDAGYKHGYRDGHTDQLEEATKDG
jgi:flagellar biosynthesis/type III secretory pathway protein FliH